MYRVFSLQDEQQERIQASLREREKQLTRRSGARRETSFEN